MFAVWSYLETADFAWASLGPRGTLVGTRNLASDEITLREEQDVRSHRSEKIYGLRQDIQ